ncbi:copper homeostasis protein CutC [Priestia megaterium]|uniref:copper homeostasis protein CutC n=1 Tax=Priestia megaterium TaxID=1404 RepID=UPI0013E3465F|nr:copper homeostasis protein CutC [Priestia megaterium]MED3864266.1 copper homeostasis protein CutC [Priestia megaterium]MED4100836.1 copper homeostasis protein CutC [Priestia megaterium]MED4144113.1 copper homeostasis protein CutC [Priestia megaterium]MED4165412.1 copper homeostasis protein CutC [Priestia megaterium]MED4198442.1 copper homeostasis protein CutC [Priestia megaterium]
MKYIKEACVEGYEQAKKAEKLGADRIELCDNLSEGGTTPSYGTIRYASEHLDTDINVIIRPRSGDFVYSEAEFQIMKKDVKACKDLRVNGVVFGILTEEAEIDYGRTKELIAEAYPLSVTFHMAFDEVHEKHKAIDILSELGADRILTKGGKGSALQNLHMIRELITYANERIIILPGGGIHESNAERVMKETKAAELHGTKIVGDLSP